MRFLIVAAAVFACAAAAPSGALLASPYSGLIATPWASPVAVASPLAVARTVALPAAVPTIPPGDIQGAALEANAAAVDAVQAVNDQASELQGRAINAAEDNAWQSVSAVQTAQAQVDGAAASIAPNVAKSLVGPVAPVATYAAAPALLAPGINTLGYARSIVAPGIPALGYARSIAAPGIIAGSGIVAGSQSISTQSLSQTHPSLLVSAPVSYAAHGW